MWHALKGVSDAHVCRGNKSESWVVIRVTEDDDEAAVRRLESFQSFTNQSASDAASSLIGRHRNGAESSAE